MKKQNIAAQKHGTHEKNETLYSVFI